MSKLNEIAGRYCGLEYSDADMEWLVERVRKLEKGLIFYQDVQTYMGEWDVCPIWNDLGIRAREALRED